MATENKDNRLLSTIEREYKRAIGLSKSVENYVSLSKFYFRTGRKKEAQSVLLEAQKDYPYSLRLRMEMGKFYIATKDHSKAIHLLTEIEDLLRKYDNEGRRRIEVLEALARAKKETGDIEGVKKIEDELRAIKK
jgi:predicted Zn-dependent protease